MSILLHEHAVRQVAWHPQKAELLIITANNAVAVIHYWSPNSHPRIVRVPISRSETGRYHVKWLASSEQQDFSAFWFWTTDEYVVGHIVDETFNILYTINTKS